MTFDQILIDADAKTLIRALAAAQQTASPPGSQSSTELLERTWVRWLAESKSHRQGQRRRQPPAEGFPYTLVGLIWWTDPVGRRHHRILGQRVRNPDRFIPRLFTAESMHRSPLWKIYPDRLFLCTPEREAAELLAVCDCGAVGAPASLAWMGDCCGPCHDQREAGLLLATTPERCLLWVGHPSGGMGIVGVGFSSDGQTVIAATAEGTIHFWDRRTRRARAVHRRSVTENSAQMGFACDGHIVVVSSARGLAFWDAYSGNLRYEIGEGRDRYGLALNSRGELLLAGVGTFGLHVWRRGTSHLDSPPLHAARSDIFCAAFAPNRPLLAQGRHAGIVELSAPWLGATSRYLFLGEPAPIRAVAWSPDGRSLAASTGSAPFVFPGEVLPSQIGWWDIRSGNLRASFQCPHTVSCLTFSPDGRHVVAADMSGCVRVWHVDSARPVATLEWHLGFVYALAFSPDGRTLATGSSDGVLKLWPWPEVLGT
jgi:WD40 repeat protein